jgi:hypothetical protein
MSDQKKLDDMAGQLWKLKRETEKMAVKACDDGDDIASERLHIISAKLHEAYGLGRGLQMQSGDGIIKPLSGGK